MHKSLSGDLLTLQRTIHKELEDANRARIDGNEGRARVCARRAAGWAVSFTRSVNEKRKIEANAYEMLQWLSQQADAPDAVRSAATRLTAHVSLDHTLPFPEDPLEDARMIVEALLGVSWTEMGKVQGSGNSALT
ncbi:MAG: hypothetical protein GQ524_11555 [Anaerolineales bacterium]|nr:hypothetical protein [Anaerolineales bacterium]